MKDHEIAKLVSELAKTAEEFAGTQQLRQVISNLVAPVLKAERDELEALRAENERLKFAMTVPKYCEDHQEWAGMDGAFAFHLIERHGENWAHCGQLMEAWRNANPPNTAKSIIQAGPQTEPTTPQSCRWIDVV